MARELEKKIKKLEERIVELEKINAFQENESKEYVTKEEAKLGYDANINTMGACGMSQR